MSPSQLPSYLDNAATSFPKAPGVGRAMARFLEDLAVNPGRSGYDLSLEAGREIDHLRARLDRFFHNPAHDPDRTIFCGNATAALNIAIQGVCRPGDHVITSPLDHNSVLRPLHELSTRGLITWDLVDADALGRVDPTRLRALLRPETRLVVLTHASNVCGRIQPVAEVGRFCREHDLLFLLDAAQTAGILPIDMAEMKVDMVAFTGHKGLLGPTGTGGLLVGPRAEVTSTRWGGTGVRSAEPGHLREYPYRLEAGTLNSVGLAGLAAGLDWVQEKTLAAIGSHERALADRLLEKSADIPGLLWHGIAPGTPTALEPDQLAVLSCTLEGRDPSTVGLFLDADFDIAVRTGLQCAPLAHKVLGTAPAGTVRISPGPFNTPEQMDQLVQALRAIATG